MESSFYFIFMFLISIIWYGLCREYLGDGITVWLDVPVEDLARRVTTVGTESRPLLGGDSCDFETAFSKLSKLMDAREQHYARAHCRLSLRGIVSYFHVNVFLFAA